MALRSWRAAAIILALAAVLSAYDGLWARAVQERYLDHHPYYYDAVSYSYYNARLYQRWRGGEGRWALAAEEWRNNGRNPLCTVSLLLLAPSWLGTRTGHMAPILAAFFACLSLVGWCLWRRRGSLAYALGGMALLAALPGWWDATRGLGANLIDLPAALWLGAGVCCLLEYHRGGGPWWPVGFAGFLALGVLCRLPLAGYALVMCGPPLLWILGVRWRGEEHRWRRVALPWAVAGLVLLVLTGPYLWRHLAFTLQFYSHHATDVGKGLGAAALATVQFFTRLLGRAMILAWLLLLAGNLVLRPPRGGGDWGELAVLVWLACSHPAFLTLVMRLGGHAQAWLPALVPMFLLCAAPLPHRTVRPTRPRLALGLTLLAAVTALYGLARYPLLNWQWAAQPRPAQARAKAFDIALARRLAAQGRHLVWLAAFEEYSVIPTMEAFYRFRRLPLPAGQDYFFTHFDDLWQWHFPGRSPQEVAELVKRNLDRYVGLAVVYARPSQAARYLEYAYPRTIAAHLAGALARDPGWEKAFALSRGPFGPLVAYRNRRRQDQERIYRRILRTGNALPTGWRPPPPPEPGRGAAGGGG